MTANTRRSCPRGRPGRRGLALRGLILIVLSCSRPMAAALDKDVGDLDVLDRAYGQAGMTSVSSSSLTALGFGTTSNEGER